MKLKLEPKDGLSLRHAYCWMGTLAVVISATMLLITVHLSQTFRRLTKVTENHIELGKAAHELMDASDYLTQCVQRYVVSGDDRFLDGYFTEAFESQRREEAVARMAVDETTAPALAMLQKAMDGSLELMNNEYYAMRLVLDAQGHRDLPEPLQDVQLSQDDISLGKEEKLARAVEIVFGDDYYAQKADIRSYMDASLAELEKLTLTTDYTATDNLRRVLNLIRLTITLQTLGIFFMVWLTSRLGINPVLQAVERIQADSPIPEVGANEFRYLARTYNKLYAVYKNSLEHLNYQASHDQLTGAYNRSGYDLLLSSIDLSTTYMLLFDLDDFKSINDTYGHEMGDKVLVKMVNTLRGNFRRDDHICRIGGDEFIVFMVHASQNSEALIGKKIENINKELKDTSDGLPPISTSVGIVHGSESTDPASLFEKTDEAMYKSKAKGKHTYTFSHQGV